MQKTLKIKLKDKEFEAVDDISLIANNLEFLGFASVTDRVSGNRLVFTTENLVSIEEVTNEQIRLVDVKEVIRIAESEFLEDDLFKIRWLLSHTTTAKP